MSAPEDAGPSAAARPETLVAVRRGLAGRCPVCGEGRIFPRFLRVASECPSCGAELHHQRADDFPPYIVIFLVGHLVGYGIYAAESHVEAMPLWIHAAIWPALTILLCLALLQPVKGAVVGLQYGLGMHGFGGDARHEPAGAGETAGAGSERSGAVGAVELRRS